jgi:hypothetical protein
MEGREALLIFADCFEKDAPLLVHTLQILPRMLRKSGHQIPSICNSLA